MFSCWYSWVVTAKTYIAVKFIKKYEKALRKPHSCEVMVCSLLGICHNSAIQKIKIPKIRIPRAKSTACNSVYFEQEASDVLINVKIKRQIQHLWFIKELLQKILTIAERCFSQKTSQPGICRIQIDEFYWSYYQPPSCDRTFCRNSCEKNVKWNQMKIDIYI